MCPFCLSTIAMAVTGAASSGSMAALVFKKFRVHRDAKNSNSQPIKEKENATEDRLAQ
jgi:hypothetical protein